MGTSLLRHLGLVAASFVTLAAGASQAHAQAWVPDPGDLGAELDYNFGHSSKVVTDTTYDFNDSGTQSHTVSLGLEYAPIEHLAIGASLPMQSLKYTGTPDFAHGPYDDGKFHTTLTDFRGNVRYQVLEEPLALTPNIGVTIPVADYETQGNTVAGRHLKQLHFGVAAGKLVGLSSYIHATYEFTLSEKYDANEKTKQFTQNRSDMSLAIGRKFLDYKLDLHLAANYRVAHGGISLLDIDASRGGKYAGDPMIVPFHDAILAENVFLVGGGIGYDISPKLTATLDFRYFVWELSHNTVNASIVALSLQWAIVSGSL